MRPGKVLPRIHDVIGAIAVDMIGVRFLKLIDVAMDLLVWLVEVDAAIRVGHEPVE